MGFFGNLFGSSSSSGGGFNPIQVDMHNHLFPGIDDGVETHEQSIATIKGMYEMGYRKFIITPHVMTDFYKNSPETIIECCNKLRVVLKEHNIDVAIEPSAEYYLDEGFSTLIKEKKLLSFGKPNYVLVETNYMEKTNNFFDLMFQLKLAGYTPILAHPERYLYLYDDFSKYEDIFEREILFQVNLMSLCGYYSPMALKIAKKLMEKNMIHFIGSDIHSPKHLVHLQKSIDTKLFKQIAALPLLNNSLL